MLDPLVLAQQARPLSIGPYLFAVMAAIGVLVLGGLVVLYLRRRVLEQQRAMDSAGSFMEQLRAMKRSGQITEAEYERTRKAMAAKVSAKMDTARSNGLFELPETRPRPLHPTRQAPPMSASADPQTQSSGRVPKTGDVVAPPGYDLTGERLPGPSPARSQNPPGTGGTTGQGPSPDVQGR